MAGNKELEEMLETMEEDAVGFLEEMAENTNPYGMTLATSKDQLFDWQNRGPDYWPKIIAEASSQAATAGLTWGHALLEVAKLDMKMQKMSGET